LKYRTAPASGLKVSLVGLGCNAFGGRSDFPATERIVNTAIDHGINFFDTSDSYPPGNRGVSEEFLGRIFKDKRKDIVLATKFGSPLDKAGLSRGGSRRHIMLAVEDSLRRLNTDWIDLYQLHHPDADTPIEETLRALDDLIRQGKVRYIGCSNMPAWQVIDAYHIAHELGASAFVSCQDEYSLLNRDVEDGLVPAIGRAGAMLLPFFPLAGGLLTGKYEGEPAEGARLAKTTVLGGRFMTERNLEIVETLKAFCAERDRTLLDLAFSWLAAQPYVWSVMAGASRPEQIATNVQAAEWVLTQEELAAIDQLTGKKPASAAH